MNLVFKMIFSYDVLFIIIFFFFEFFFFFFIKNQKIKNEKEKNYHIGHGGFINSRFIIINYFLF